MARHEQDKEDLLREAVAFLERVEFLVDDRPVFVGFRRDGAGSVYFDQDPVYQFTAAGLLRRAYISGLRYKADHGRLHRLTPSRSAASTSLLNHPLTPAETTTLLSDLHGRLASLSHSLSSGRFTLVGQVPPSPDLSPRVLSWLSSLGPSPGVADSPRAV